jgi:hypothetical protein
VLIAFPAQVFCAFSANRKPTPARQAPSFRISVVRSRSARWNVRVGSACHPVPLARRALHVLAVAPSPNGRAECVTVVVFHGAVLVVVSGRAGCVMPVIRWQLPERWRPYGVSLTGVAWFRGTALHGVGRKGLVGVSTDLIRVRSAANRSHATALPRTSNERVASMSRLRARPPSALGEPALFCFCPATQSRLHSAYRKEVSDSYRIV